MPSSIWHLESRLKRFGNPLCQQDLASDVDKLVLEELFACFTRLGLSKIEDTII